MIRHYFLVRPVAAFLYVTLTVLHPLLHPFEGGALDAFIEGLRAWALTQ